MKNYRQTAVRIALLFSTHFVSAQRERIYFTHLDVEDGLYSNTVNSIVQDSQGFMWFATKNGVNRYDGYQFKVFGKNPDDPNSLNHIEIYSIFADSQKNLWVGSGYAGVDRYDPEKENFSPTKLVNVEL